MNDSTQTIPAITIGLDLGDKWSFYCVIDRDGEMVEEKKRAVVAVARKLAVLLHRLWITGEVYEPLHNSSLKEPRRTRASA